MRVSEGSAVVRAVEQRSPADVAGILPGDEVHRVNGTIPRDVIEWKILTDSSHLELDISRGGVGMDIDISKREGEPLGIEVTSAVFDRVRTCDNHCPFCFIYQLPDGLRRSLYLKDDDYRLSFLYGNFTTLTRFTEADFERVLDQGLSPLNVSVHTTDPILRSEMLRNRRGAVSLRWLKQLIDHGVTVNAQIVVCPDINGDHVLENTLMGILDEFPGLNSVAVVPLGLSRFNTEPSMRVHTRDEALRVIEIVREWQVRFLKVLGRRMVFASDEFFIVANEDFPACETYEGFHLHEDGIGMARTFELEFLGRSATAIGTQPGFFASVDGAPASGYRAPRNPAGDTGMRSHLDRCQTRTVAVSLATRRRGSQSRVGVLTGTYGAVVVAPLVDSLGLDNVTVVVVENEFFGGNTSVTGLLVGTDIKRTIESQPPRDVYLLPDVCVSEGRFLDGTTLTDLPSNVRVVSTDGIALRSALKEYE